MTYSEFCEMNGVDATENVHILSRAKFPEGEFTADFTLVIYATAGRCPICIDGGSYEIRRKSISVWRPGHRINFHPDESLEYQLLLLSSTLQQYLNTDSVYLTLFVANEYPVIRITSAYNEALKLFFESITIVAKFQDNPYKSSCLFSIIKALFYSTGYYIFRSLRFRDGNLSKFASSYPSMENGVTARFLQLVEQHSMRERKLSFYARELDYNPNYLSSLVKRETGHSGQSIIDQYSLLAAMAKLSYGHQSIKEIADAMNFQSQSDFGKFFKRMTGISPNHYRKTRFSGILG